MADRTQILSEIRRLVKHSAPNTKLTAIRNLMQNYTTSQRMIESVLNSLAEEELIVRRPGCGWFVKEEPSNGLPRFRLVLPNWASENCRQIENGFRELAETGGKYTFQSMMLSPDENFFRALPVEGCDALIVASPRGQLSAEEVVILATLSVPAAVLYCDLGGVGVSMVSEKPSFSGQVAAAHLIRNGHRKLALLVTEPHSDSFDTRCDGFIEFAKLSGVEVEVIETGIRAGDSFRGACYRALERHREQYGDSYTGLFLGSSESALEVYKFFGDHGISIPEQVSIIGNDRLAGNEFLSPPLSCVGTDPGEIVTESVNGLFRVLAEECPYFHARINSNLLIRPSVRMLSHLE